jgi:hypothetical protein
LFVIKRNEAVIHAAPKTTIENITLHGKNSYKYIVQSHLYETSGKGKSRDKVVYWLPETGKGWRGGNGSD